METNKRLRVGSIVKVAWAEHPYMKKEDRDLRLETKPKIGRIVFVHPKKLFYTVEFRDRYTAEYKPMYRQSFWPEQLERIHQPNFMKPRPAKKRSWAVQEGI